MFPIDILIIVVCLYFAFQNARDLAGVPIGEWQLVQWLLALVSLALVAVAALRGRTMYKNFKAKQKAEATAGEEGQEEQAPQPEKAPPKVPSAFDDDDDLAYLDELDAEEDALRAEKAIGEQENCADGPDNSAAGEAGDDSSCASAHVTATDD